MSDESIKVLVVDDEAAMREVLELRLDQAGFEVHLAESGEEARDAVDAVAPDLVLSDVVLPDANGVELLDALRGGDENRPIILMTAYGTVDSAVEAMKLGAFDFLTKPLDYNQLEQTLGAACRKLTERREARILEGRLATNGGYGPFVGTSRVMRRMYETLELLAGNDATALIVGASGTGKELAARTLHDAGRRRRGPFIAVNMAALPETLTERELFGHSRGAFTGADRSKPGLFESAHEGTLFLDEICEMPIALQPKLLRALEEGTVRRLGSSTSKRVDVRIVAATNRDPQRAIRDGRLREDLFYRLSVFTVQVPPLSTRRDDLPLLAQAFVRRFNAKHSTVVEGVSAAALARLQQHSWPGNVRELRNVLERAVILTKSGWIEEHHLPEFLREEGNAATGDHIAVPVGSTVAEAERILILETLKRLDNNRSQTARALGVTARTIRNKLKAYREDHESRD